MRDLTDQQQGDGGAAGFIEGENSIAVSVMELRLPCRSFRISYKVAEAGEFSLTTEFLLRMLRLLDGLLESSVAEFFGFTNDETHFVINVVENKGLVRRTNGKVFLTDAGHRLFIAGEEPTLFEVHSKQDRFDFDLLSFSPADTFRMLDEFEFELPELSISDAERGEHASDLVLKAFKKHFQEFRLKRGGARLEAQSLYTVDDAQAEQRFGTVVPVTVAVSINEPSLLETNLLNWRSGAELDDRAAIVHRCADFAKGIRVRADQLSIDAAGILAKFAPVQLVGLYKSGKLNAEAFFKATAKQAGELRIDRPTVRTIGQLWTDANRLRFASALKYAVTTLGNKPPAVQIWLRPSVPFWGTTKRVAEILMAVSRTFSEITENGVSSIRSVMVSDDRADGAFKHVFNGIVNLPVLDLPSGLEIFLVPGYVAYIAIHTPVGQSEGYPIPLGIISFDPETVTRGQAALSKILGTPLAIQRHCDWGAPDIIAGVRAAL
jgi:hypothetical protein